MSSIFNLENYYFNPYALPHFIVGVLISLEGLFVFFQGKKTIVHVAYTITTVTAGIWLMGVGIGCSLANEALSLVVYRTVSFFGIIFITPAVYFFSASWNAELLRQKRKWILFHYLSAAAFYFACVFTPYLIADLYHYSTGYFPKAGILESVFIVWFYALMALSFANFIRIRREGKTAVVKKNTTLMFAAFVIAFFGSVEYLPNYGLHVFPVAFLPMFLFTTIMGYCVIRYRLMDIQTVIHKTFMWFLASSVMGVPVVTFCYLFREWLYRLPAPAFIVVCILLFLLIVLYTRHIQPKIDHMFQRRKWDLLRAHEKFTEELVYLKDLSDVIAHILQTVKTVFYADNVSLLLRKGEEDSFAVVAGSEFMLKPGGEFSFKDDFLKWLESEDAIVIEEYLTIDPRFRASVAECGKIYFEICRAKLCVPIVVNQKLIAVLNVGEKKNLQPFRAPEINFLSDLRRSAAIALSNSIRLIAMQENLRKWNEELEKKVEERTRQLQDTQAQLVQAEKLATIGTLAGGVAHEINNPLTAVLTNAQILKMDAKPDDLESLSLIEEGAKRCQAIVQKLMKYARKPVEAETVGKVDIHKMIDTSMTFLDYQLKQDNITLVLKKGDLGSLLVAGNTNELEQVITNLVLNAKDAIRHAGRAGEITIETFSRDGGVRIVVRDNGIGIPRENLQKIFDPFFTTKEIGKGTGLGLAVTYGIIQKHSGQIKVESQPGHGAAFTVSLPALK